MNAEEFRKWLDDYLTQFPGTREWLAKVCGSDQQMGATLRGWRKTLSMTPYSYAVAVTDRMVRGEIETVEAYERDQTALIVRKHAADMRHADREDRARREQSARAASQKRWEEQNFSGRYRYGMGQVFRAYLKMLQSGDPQATEKMCAMSDEPPESGQEGHSATDGYRELFSAQGDPRP